MIRLFGEIALYLALFISVLQSFLPLVGFYRQNIYLRATARPLVFAQCGFIIIAYILLTIAFVINDFSILYVAENSHPNLPFMYRLTAVWGSHEGSILLWILILNIWSCVYAMLVKNNEKSYALVIAILGLISFGFLCFLLFTSSPFLPIPLEYANYKLTGNDLNPLLQDPGFVIHPPMLYLGYVGFSVAFAITLAALLSNSLTLCWAQLTRQFALAAWACLSLGITLGSWWSYRVLGWGGFWFWDPVENASLLPWIAGLALIHVLIVVEKKDGAKAWAVLLAIITFAMSILGTFLVRSGILISAHTFANDPTRGFFLLLLLASILVITLLLYVIYLPKQNLTTIKSPWLSRQMILIINSGLLIIAMLTILLGTIYPLILDALQLGLISVGAPYFNTVLLPLLFLIMFFMGLGPLTHWQKQPAKILLQNVFKNLIASILLSAILLWYFSPTFTVNLFLSLSLSFWIILAVINYFRILPGMSIAHLGFAITIIGIMLATALNVGKEVLMKPGERVDVGPYRFYFIDVKGITGPNYRGVEASFDVFKNLRPITTMQTDKRIYTVREMVMTKVGIHPGLFRDLYIALGEPGEKNEWSVRIYYKPFVRFIWLGGILMLIGGFVAIVKRR